VSITQVEKSNITTQWKIKLTPEWSQLPTASILCTSAMPTREKWHVKVLLHKLYTKCAQISAPTKNISVCSNAAFGWAQYTGWQAYALNDRKDHNDVWKVALFLCFTGYAFLRQGSAARELIVRYLRSFQGWIEIDYRTCRPEAMKNDVNDVCTKRIYTSPYISKSHAAMKTNYRLSSPQQSHTHAFAATLPKTAFQLRTTASTCIQHE